MKNTNELVDVLFGLFSKFILNENIWLLIGSKGFPKRGRIFDIFVSSKKLALENFVIREVFALFMIDITKTISSYDRYFLPEYDHRALVLTGVIDRAYSTRLFGNFDHFLDTLRVVKSYTKNNDFNEITESFTNRLISITQISKSEYDKYYAFAILFFLKMEDQNAFILNQSYLIKLFEEYDYTELLIKKSRKLDEQRFNEIINTSTFLLK